MVKHKLHLQVSFLPSPCQFETTICLAHGEWVIVLYCDNGCRQYLCDFFLIHGISGSGIGIRSASMSRAIFSSMISCVNSIICCRSCFSIEMCSGRLSSTLSIKILTSIISQLRYFSGCLSSVLDEIAEMFGCVFWVGVMAEPFESLLLGKGANGLATGPPSARHAFGIF